MIHFRHWVKMRFKSALCSGSARVLDHPLECCFAQDGSEDNQHSPHRNVLQPPWIGAQIFDWLIHQFHTSMGWFFAWLKLNRSGLRKTIPKADEVSLPLLPSGPGDILVHVDALFADHFESALSRHSSTSDNEDAPETKQSSAELAGSFHLANMVPKLSRARFVTKTDFHPFLKLTRCRDTV